MTDIIAYTDGSCMKKKAITYCGYGVYFPNNEKYNISDKIVDGKRTNQVAELYAIYAALLIITKMKKINSVKIYSDSLYSIKSLTVWIQEWKKNDWKNSKKKDVENKDLILKIDSLIASATVPIIFEHVYGHFKNDKTKSNVHSINNDKADKLAKSGAIKN